jgi:uncharacterized membrane protein
MFELPILRSGKVLPWHSIIALISQITLSSLLFFEIVFKKWEYYCVLFVVGLYGGVYPFEIIC